MRIVTLITLILGLSIGNALHRSGEITVYNIGHVVEIGQISFPNSRIWDIVFQPQSDNLAVIVDRISGSPPLRSYDVVFVNSESLETTVQTEDVLQATAMTFSADGSLFAIGNLQGEIGIYNTENYREVSRFPAGGLVVTELAFNSDHSLLGATFGNPVLTGEGEHAFQLWSLRNGESIFSYPFGAGVYGGGVAFDDTGEKVLFSVTDASVSVENSAIQVWDASISQASVTRYQPRPFNDELIFDVRTGAMFYIGEKSIHMTYPFIEEPNDDFQMGFEQEGENITSIALHPNESVLAVGYTIRTLNSQGVPTVTGAGNIRIYDSETGEVLASLDVPEGAITHVAFSPDGTLLASGGADATVRLWGVPAGE